jgi:hypothetical protein
MGIENLINYTFIFILSVVYLFKIYKNLSMSKIKTLCYTCIGFIFDKTQHDIYCDGIPLDSCCTYGKLLKYIYTKGYVQCYVELSHRSSYYPISYMKHFSYSKGYKLFYQNLLPYLTYKQILSFYKYKHHKPKIIYHYLTKHYTLYQLPLVHDVIKMIISTYIKLLK